MQLQYDTSVAGFFQCEGALREIFNFNVGWRFLKRDVEGGEGVDFDDSEWQVVNAPHGLELLPYEASGSPNYQGVAWYRKQFDVPANTHEKRLVIHFEAIMGKSEVWVNGQCVGGRLGGFLPLTIDVTDVVNRGGRNVIAVKADNSDDPNYPPGKPQYLMDFSYFGGIYRDVWFYLTDEVHVTDANSSGATAGGGVFVHFENFWKESVKVVVETEIVNESITTRNLSIRSKLLDGSQSMGAGESQIELSADEKTTVRQEFVVTNPTLWHPDNPHLHDLVTHISEDGNDLDAVRSRIGIRMIEFKGKDGFYLNGEPFEGALIGGNRHQDFAYVGNAMSNSMHRRDVKKLREAGMKVIRTAHYPQDPAFMDACDEYGMFIIVTTPGWQFWNDDPVFENQVMDDIRNMVRRDRNHPSVLIWEPILNETSYPDTFAKKAYDAVHEEYPYQGCVVACDHNAEGAEHADLIYRHGGSDHDFEGETRSIFTREWGDNVDNWESHNSTSRVAREWGERPMLVQALHYSTPKEIGFDYASIERFWSGPRQLVGGALWHPFDHNRGYHPDVFYGGIMDAFRQPKTSYHIFKAQQDPKLELAGVETGPMVYVANQLTPFSESDVWVFSNCEEVRLTAFGKEIGTKPVKREGYSMPSPPVVFRDVHDFMDIKFPHRVRNYDTTGLKVEGLVGGEVVATHFTKPSTRRERIELEVDYAGSPLLADGSDFVTVIAKIVDFRGIVKTLTCDSVIFDIEGEGSIIGDESIQANPRRVVEGTAPLLVRSTVNAGKIKIRARLLRDSVNGAELGEIEFESIASAIPLCYKELASAEPNALSQRVMTESDKQQEALQQQSLKDLRELSKKRLKEVEDQQTQFEGNP